MISVHVCLQVYICLSRRVLVNCTYSLPVIVDESCYLCRYRIIITVDIDLSMTEDLVRLQRRVDLYLFDLILLGCVADPIIYAARMRQVRSGYARIWDNLVRRVARRGVEARPTDSAPDRIRNRSNEVRQPSNNAVRTRTNGTSSGNGGRGASEEATRFMPPET